MFDILPGETVYLVGKGPSIHSLNASYFKAGTIITINESILIVQELGLNNSILSFQKDGCHHSAPVHECSKPPAVYPKPNIPVVFQRGRSEWCLPNHKNRLYVTVEELGFTVQITMSILMAAAMAQKSNAGKIIFVCCDSLVGDTREVLFPTNEIKFTRSSGYYNYAKPLVEKMVLNYPHEYIIPTDTTK